MVSVWYKQINDLICSPLTGSWCFTSINQANHINEMHLPSRLIMPSL